MAEQQHDKTKSVVADQFLRKGKILRAARTHPVSAYHHSCMVGGTGIEPVTSAL
jgi:hypothetical protein